MLEISHDAVCHGMQRTLRSVTNDPTSHSLFLGAEGAGSDGTARRVQESRWAQPGPPHPEPAAQPKTCAARGEKRPLHSWPASAGHCLYPRSRQGQSGAHRDSGSQGGTWLVTGPAQWVSSVLAKQAFALGVWIRLLGRPWGPECQDHAWQTPPCGLSEPSPPPLYGVLWPLPLPCKPLPTQSESRCPLKVKLGFTPRPLSWQA